MTDRPTADLSRRTLMGALVGVTTAGVAGTAGTAAANQGEAVPGIDVA